MEGVLEMRSEQEDLKDRELNTSEAMCRGMFEHNMMNGVAIYGVVDDGNDFVINWLNATAATIENADRSRLAGGRLTEVLPGAREFGLFEVMQRVWLSGNPENFPVKYYHDNHIQGWREYYICKLPSDQLMVIYNDLTSQKKAEEELRESEELLKTILDKMQMGIFIVDAETHCILDINAKALKMIEAVKEHVIGEQCREFICASECGSCPITDHNQSVDNAEHRLITATGNVIPVLKTVTKVNLRGREHLIESFVDIRERKELEEGLRAKATTDALTGIYNRGYFIERGEKEVSRALRYNKPLSLIMLDFDNFKKINDSYGHPVGDEVLKTVANLCVSQLRESDFIGRLGGEEFGILAVECELPDAVTLAERIRKLVEETAIPLASGETVGSTLSLGISSINDSIDDIDVLLKEADVALYKAKKAGRNSTMAQSEKTIV